jgi:hypothetical protein
MKMVKSLLLGSAAGLVAVAGAQAADLPVKAKPVEYVKICSIYGVGFFYIPGTDTCIKIGGWVRAEVDFNAGGSHTSYISGGRARNNRIDSADTQWRSRFVMSFDVRTQTEYGTLRAYNRAGFQWTTNEDGQGTYYVERTFIQFAGFTFGRSQSYFDFYANAMYYTGYIGGPSSTGAAGTNVFAYTATFGNGLTATISLEEADAASQRDLGCRDRRACRSGRCPGPSTQTATGYTARAPGLTIGDYAAHQVPDIVGALRVDQAWGSAQIAWRPAPGPRGLLRQQQQTRCSYNGSWRLHRLCSRRQVGLRQSWPASCSTCRGRRVTSSGSKVRIRSVRRPIPASTRTVSTAFGPRRRAANVSWSAVALGCGVRQRDPLTGLPAAVRSAAAVSELTTVWTIAAALQHYWTPALRTSGVRRLQRDRLQLQCDEHLLLVAEWSGPQLRGCGADLRHRSGYRL